MAKTHIPAIKPMRIIPTGDKNTERINKIATDPNTIPKTAEKFVVQTVTFNFFS